MSVPLRSKGANDQSRCVAPPPQGGIGNYMCFRADTDLLYAVNPFFNIALKLSEKYTDNTMMDYQNIQKNLVDWLVLHRNLKGLTQAQLSKLLGKNQSFVSKYENCERNLIITEFLEICTVLECDTADKLQGVINALKNKRGN